MKSTLNPKDFVTFFSWAEKIKTTYRHAVTSDIKRRESVAEHSWLVTLLAVVIHPHLTIQVDLLRLLKMLLVHDLGEAVHGDVPAFIKDKNGNQHLGKERDGLEKMVSSLPQPFQSECLSLFDEFEALKTDTAQVAKAIDRFEALMQHNLIPITTWDQGDFDIQPYYQDQHFNFDPFIRQLKDYIDNQSMQKINDAQMLARINPSFINKWKAFKKAPRK
jgi:putative hydrolase of HD superfamily